MARRQGVQNFVRLARRFAGAEGSRGDLKWHGRPVRARQIRQLGEILEYVTA